MMQGRAAGDGERGAGYPRSPSVRPRRAARSVLQRAFAGSQAARGGTPRPGPRMHRRCFGIVALALLATIGLAGVARGEPMRRLPRSVPRALARMVPAGRAPGDLRLEHVIVFLGLRD